MRRKRKKRERVTVTELVDRASSSRPRGWEQTGCSTGFDLGSRSGTEAQSNTFDKLNLHASPVSKKIHMKKKTRVSVAIFGFAVPNQHSAHTRAVSFFGSSFSEYPPVLSKHPASYINLPFMLGTTCSGDNDLGPSSKESARRNEGKVEF